MDYIATAMMDYVTDKGVSPVSNGTLVGNTTLYAALSGFYLKVLPQNDQWGNPFYVYGGTAGEARVYGRNGLRYG